MEHYLEHIDYPIWEVIQKGNAHVQVSTDIHGQIRVLPPKTVEEILARERERKARTTLLMAIPEDHLAKFHKITNAKEMSLPSSWSHVSLIMRTKPGVETLSFDDLYNNLRVFEFDVKGSTGSSSSTPNMTFVSSDNTSSTNKVNTAYGVSTSSAHNSQREGSSSYIDELMYSFFANQSTGLKLDHEDLKQLDEFDLEEMDLKWQVAMISMRLKKFYKKTGRKLHFDAKEPVVFDKNKVECFNCHNTGNFARECRSKGSQENDKEDYALMAFNSSNSGSDTEQKMKKIKAELKTKLENFQNSSKGLSKLLNSQMSAKDKSGLGDIEDSPVNDRFLKVKGMHAVSPPMTGFYMPPKSNFGIDESKFTYGPKQSKNVESKPKAVSEPKVWSDAPINEEYESDSDDECCSTTKNGDEKLNEDASSNTNKEPVDQEDQAFLEELEKLKRQEKEANDADKTLRKTFAQNTKDLLLQAGAARASSTNYVNTINTPVNTASTPVKTASLSRNVNAVGPSSPNLLTYANQDDCYIPSLEDIYAVPNDGIFTSASYDAKGAVADFINLESSMNIEPKKISQALEEESWVDAMQEELLQFKTQQGHRQEEGIDNDEVFALVVRLEAIRIFLASSSYIGFIVYHMDVKSTFLYGKIDKEVYVSQPPGFIDPKFPKKNRFQMSSMGELTFFLGLQVKQKEDGIFISQDKYVTEILKKFNFMSMKTASTPIETKKPLVKDAEAADVDVHLYRSMIGSLMCLTASRPDIMYAVYACSRFLVTPKTSHLQAVNRIFRYHKCQPKLGLWYPRESAFDLEAYLDSDYAGANLDRKSTTGEAEYVAAANYCGQVLWIQNQMHHFIRDAYEKKLIQVLKIHTDENVVVLLTKAFDVSRENVNTVRSTISTVSQQEDKKAKTGLNIEEGNFNKLDDLVGKGADYAMNKGRSTDKIKVLNAEAEGVSVVGETLSTAIVFSRNPQQDLQEKGVIDSRCSRHMTGNMSYLPDYEEIDRGYVAFGGNPKGGKITGKGGLTCLFPKATSDESKLWHRRLGHLNFKTMIKLVKGNLVRGLPSKIFKNNQDCVACQKGKQHRAFCKTKTENSISLPLHLFHMDLFGPTFVKSLMKKMYCLAVTDDFSRFTWVFFLASKDETIAILKTFITGIENQVDHKLKVIRSDNRTEFKNREMNQFCEMKDHLRKFDGKADEGFFVGYSLHSKTFIVFNNRTRIMEENLHVRFSENTPIITGRGPKWLFDIDALTKSMNYKPVVAGNHANGNVEKLDNVNSTNNVNAAGTNRVNVVGTNTNNELLFDLEMPELEDINTFNFSNEDEDNGAEADMNNLDTTIQVSPTPTIRIYKDYPLDQVIGDLHSTTQTRNMSNNLEEHGFVSTINQRTNHKDLQNCLFACFLSQKEPKKVIHALKDLSWIEAMLEELLQFKLQEV
uniref:Uncharacterized mitochondrial protein AtMg00810-like n=1 Tax=Tanacetum cinerariifolium TaxID=118510 RepID=A0A6L2NU69_TANCI|nr:uncharacterized mitochondrial protein AtMg00810-like [Tanacetum cinerariifolium]